MRRTRGMAEQALRAPRHKVALIGAVFVLFALVPGLHAASLKDIRIGEYTAYTRVVFEFDGPVAVTDRIVQSQGRITLIFPQTGHELVRKIPFDRSQRIKKVQLWLVKNGLSVVLLFDFEHYRFESFSMRNPFRVALDIYPLTAPGVNATLPSGETAAQQPAHGSPKLEAPAAKQNDTAKGPPQVAASAEKPSPLEIKEQAAPSGAQSPQGPQATVLLRSQSPPSQNQPKHIGNIKRNTSKPVIDGPAAAKSHTSLLQHYLVLALVVMTIVILGLLVMMLLSRHKWTDDQKPMGVNDLLKQQDDRIASLNARIQEQLKRYDEA